jgi:hypothetical protein
MTHHPEPLVWSDAWLLLALLLSSADGAVGRGGLIEAGDYINHAVFTEEELSGGIRRLRARGNLLEDGGRYRAAPTVREWYAKACPACCSVWTALERVEGFLGLSRGGQLDESP